VQHAAPDPPGDPAIAQPELAQLVARDHAMLPHRDVRDRLVERG
jgi:hypothetical protein